MFKIKNEKKKKNQASKQRQQKSFSDFLSIKVGKIRGKKQNSSFYFFIKISTSPSIHLYIYIYIYIYMCEHISRNIYFSLFFVL
jgi:hypothetical protein